MKLPDVNIWVALNLSDHTHRKASKLWFDDNYADNSILFCRATQQGFLRILTNPSVLKIYGLDALTNHQAWHNFETAMTDTRISFADEPVGIVETWKSLALRKTASPKLWMDAYLAAFAIKSGFQLITADHAFTQFKGLNLHLIAS
jgi:uncharacterized protein